MENCLFMYLPLFFYFLMIPMGLISSPLPEFNNELDRGEQDLSVLCDPLSVQGTTILCFQPFKNQSISNTGISCSEPSLPGTKASYSCRNFKGVVYTGFLTCSASGAWITNLEHANNSLCNLDASIINFEDPDIVVATDIPDFTTPIPNLALLPPDISFLNDHEKVALQLHNAFRRNHNVPPISMSKQLSTAAQKLVERIMDGSDVDENWESEFKWNLINRTVNIETNWYFQTPSAFDNTEAVSNAVQTWYSGFLKYDWSNIENNLEVGDALAFARVIWKATTLMGVGVFNSRNLTFVSCLYTPVVLTYALPSPPMRMPAAYGKLPIEAEPSSRQDEFVSLITKNLTPEQCSQLNQYFSSHKALVLERINEFGVQTNGIPSGMRKFLDTGPVNRHGRECLMKLESFLRSNPYDLKDLIYDGLLNIHRADLSKQLKSLVSHQKHNDIVKGLDEIKRHKNTALRVVSDAKNEEDWSKAIMDLIMRDDNDEYKYKTFILILIFSTLITLIIARCIVWANSRLKAISNAHQSKLNPETEMLLKDQVA